MLNQFLHEQLTIAFEYGVPKPKMPNSITQSLNPVFELRDYQEKRLQVLSTTLTTIYREKKNPSTCYSTWQPVAVKRLSWQA